MNLHEHLASIHQLEDEALLQSLKRFVGSSNHLTALVLAHLAEVDARRAYRLWACDTLMTYCVYELRFSEDEAQRRCRAARVARQFPILFEMLADASIHLTGILLLAPYLTEENHRQVLARARYRRKREIERLVAELAPMSDVPSAIEPLGPCPTTSSVRTRAGWGAISDAAMGGVRQLVPGQGPTQAPSAPEDCREALIDALPADDSAPARNEAPAAAIGELPATDPSPPLRYKVQFTADQAYVDLIEQARALLWHQLPNGDLAELQRLALEALVEKLLRRKCGALSRASEASPPAVPLATAEVAPKPSSEPAPPQTDAPARSKTRHLPAAVRRAVWERDAGRCTFVDARGVRCRATAAIEYHHEHAHALGGPATLENIHLRCRAHNDLAAERDFGRAFMLEKRHG